MIEELHEWETIIYSDCHCSLLDSDSYGAKGYRVTSADEYSKILHECLHGNHEGVKVVEVIVAYLAY